MKKIKKISLSILLVLFGIALLGMIMSSKKPTTVSATSSNNNITDIETLSYELFGDIKIKSTEYLYNYDNSPTLRFRPNAKTLALISVGLI